MLLTELMGILRQVARWIGVRGEMTHINPGSAAPDFSLKGIDGQEYSLQKLEQKGPVVAAFFKVSCPVCQFTFPFLERIHERYGGNGVTFLGVSQDDAKATKEFARQFGVTFPIALDEKGYPASNAYGLSMVPTIFLIEADGNVKITSMGFDKKDLETIATELATRSRVPVTALFGPGESVPANRPG
jgi:peroxiredoxin